LPNKKDIFAYPHVTDTLFYVSVTEKMGVTDKFLAHVSVTAKSCSLS
jgi:hypothetical protein